MKKRTKWALGVAAAAAPLFAAGAVRADTIYTFENPSTSSGFLYAGNSDLSASGLTYAGAAGIAANGSAFSVSGASGSQAGFLQGPGSSITTGTFAGTGGIYTFTFLDEGRPGAGYGANPLTVTLTGPAGSTVVDSVTPASTTQFSTESFSAPLLAGVNYTLSFTGQGVGARDVTTFIDNVTVPDVAPTPMPKSSYAGLGLLGLVGVTQLRRKHLATA